jgi:hypothetical protein
MLASRPMPSRRTIHPASALAVASLLLAACGSGDAPRDGRPVPSDRGVPTGPSTTSPIDAHGGVLTSPDGRIALVVAPGTVTAPVTFTVEELTNTAPGAQGVAYRFGPERTVFEKPVLLVFTPDLGGARLDGLGIATQDEDGYWLRIRDVVRDPIAGTLSVPTRHFSDWSVVTRSERDLYGPFTLVSSLGLPFTASGTSTLNFAGEDAGGTYYLHWGTIALPASIPDGTATCSASEPLYDLPTNVADITRSGTRFGWGLSAHWNLACTDPFAGAHEEFLSTVFDTWGINHLGCSRAYTNGPVLGADHLAGSYTIDCGVRGAVTASWDFLSCTPGISCPSAIPCQLAAITCDTGPAVCTDTGPAPNGTTCGTDQVCNGGACVACTAAVACTPAANPCHVGATSCATGASVCEDTGASVPDGTTCGTDAVCYAGTCSACLADLPCTPAGNACHVGRTSCATGVSVCVDTGVNVESGASCGEDLVCGGGTCTACDAGAACVSPNPCTTATITCDTGAPVCTESLPLPNGTDCGEGAVCNGGVCSACVANTPCVPADACHVGATSCATGVSVCVDTGASVADGASCGTNAVCGGGVCNACEAGAACDPANPCKTGALACSSGAPVCTESGDEPDGTSCGADQVCSGGACVGCVSGAACTPANACHVGATSCTSGASVCVDTGASVADGASCGTDAVCAGGTCNACEAGATCDPANPCKTGALVCDTGTPVCTESGNEPNGTGCGTDQVCNGGACVACDAGASCTPAENACHVGATSCTTGVSVCVDTGASVADGASSGTNAVCGGGTCSACEAGATCDPADPCKTGVTECGTGIPVCTESGNEPDGTSCGTDLVCTGGVCGP